MDTMLSALAFALLIGAQFLAAIVVISRRKIIYADPEERVYAEGRRPDQFGEEVVEGQQPAKAA